MGAHPARNAAISGLGRSTSPVHVARPLRRELVRRGHSRQPARAQRGRIRRRRDLHEGARGAPWPTILAPKNVDRTLHRAGIPVQNPYYVRAQETFTLSINKSILLVEQPNRIAGRVAQARWADE